MKPRLSIIKSIFSDVFSFGFIGSPLVLWIIYGLSLLSGQFELPWRLSRISVEDAPVMLVVAIAVTIVFLLLLILRLRYIQRIFAKGEVIGCRITEIKNAPRWARIRYRYRFRDITYHGVRYLPTRVVEYSENETTPLILDPEKPKKSFLFDLFAKDQERDVTKAFEETKG